MSDKTADAAVSKDEKLKPGTTEQNQEQYQWITNEGLLRDEGTLYGIAGAVIEDKLNAIVGYFNALRAPERQKKEVLTKQRLSLEEIIQSFPQDIEKLNVSHLERSSQKASYNLLPITFQLVAYLSICYFNYYLIEYWLSPVISSKLICLGLYTFGLFSVFIGRSVLYNSTSNVNDEKTESAPREKWKIFLEEFGISLIVALFICTLAFRAYPVEYSIVAFLFLSLLFLFSGKGLINTQFRLKKEFSNYLRHIKSRLEFNRKKKELIKKKNDAENSIKEIDKELLEPEIALKKLDAEQAYKTDIFMSEYKLAQQSRQTFRNSQLSQFA